MARPTGQGQQGGQGTGTSWRRSQINDDNQASNDASKLKENSANSSGSKQGQEPPSKSRSIGIGREQSHRSGVTKAPTTKEKQEGSSDSKISWKHNRHGSPKVLRCLCRLLLNQDSLRSKLSL